MNWKKIGKKLLFPPVWLMALLVTACAAALTGLLLTALAYPLYNRVLKTQRAKIAPNILRISDELLQG